jgi:uncharacterized damage-inducible protein DinB
MQERASLDLIALDSVRRRLTRILPAQIRSCIEELDEEQLWWRPNDQSNSVGNLVLHVSGSMRHYISRGIGGVAYERDRAAEFAERGPVPKQQLLETFDETIRQVCEALDSLDTARLAEPGSEPSYNPTVFDQIFNVAIHVATHMGQIVYVTKSLKEGSIDELWIRAHRS